MAHSLRRSAIVSRSLLRHLVSDSLPKRLLSHRAGVSLIRQCSVTRDVNIGVQGRTRWSSGLSEAQPTLAPQGQVLNFINSMFSKVEGVNHRWLNKMYNEKLSFDKDRILIVLPKTCELNSTQCDNREVVVTLERVKMLQQRGSRNRFLHYTLDVDIRIIIKEIGEFYALSKDGAVIVQNPPVSRTPQQVDVKEPCIYPTMRNLLFSYPGCISVDEDGGRLFISDSNHHRVIITDTDGKIIDCIGSSPGFEDGEFESAKLLRPAASIFDDAENSLYIVDSENHAIRRADMERRVLETVYPVPIQKTNRIWSWIMDKLGFQRESALTPEVVDLDGVTLPWHLAKLGRDDLLIINRSFEMSWVMNMRTGEIKKVVRGTNTITEMYGDMISEKVLSFKDICWNSFQQRLVHYFSLEGIPHASLMSSIATIKNYTVFCDTAAQKVLKCHRESRQVECIQFSNLGILGLPYWLVSPPERYFRSGNSCYQWNEHLRQFNVLPGRCDIKVNIDIPTETELVAPLDENCIWRQARGSVAELSRLDGPADGSEKVGVAQQWFDELDNLAFSRPEADLNPENEEKYSSKCSQDNDKVHFNCTVNISPGTGEVVVSAVLYLKLKKAPDAVGQNSDAMRVIGLKSDDNIKREDEVCMKLLSDSCGDLHDIVFIKPLHLRIRLDCGDHPSADTQKEIISTETNLETSVSLE